MHFYTFQKSGIEVLHLGVEHTQSNCWPMTHWRENKGRWRLYLPAIDAYLNENLESFSFGESVERFVFTLEIADFASWGVGPAFHVKDGRVAYRPKTRELMSVGQLNWLEVRFLTPTQQLEALSDALVTSVKRVSTQKRKPKDFQTEKFAVELARLLKKAKVSKFSRSSYLKKI